MSAAAATAASMWAPLSVVGLVVATLARLTQYSYQINKREKGQTRDDSTGQDGLPIVNNLIGWLRPQFIQSWDHIIDFLNKNQLLRIIHLRVKLSKESHIWILF
jgi:hypothetical protein